MMNNSENYANSSASSAPDQELLRELMPKLGLEATEPKTHYKTQMRLRYLLPKVLAVCVLAAVLYFAGRYMLTPPQVSDMQVTEGTDKVEVAFNVDKVLLLENVTAQLDGAPVAVQYETVGSYKVDVDKNGELAISARTFTGRQSQTEMTVDSIDEEPPHISDHRVEDGDMIIFFTDGGGAGIDWQSLQAADAATGESFPLAEISEEEGFVRFPFPDSSVRITLSDNNGNPLSVILELLRSGEDAPETAENDASSPD